MQINLSVRPAVERDSEAIIAFDHLARADGERRAFIQRSVAHSECSVVVRDDQVIAYGVLNYSFFAYGFIPMVFVHPQYRRCGAGAAVVQYLGSVCQTAKVFTSTNLSNLPMQSLLAWSGYILNGVIHHLDEGDPELVYVKYLTRPSMEQERTSPPAPSPPPCLPSY